jgi:hypothetical protein
VFTHQPFYPKVSFSFLSHLTSLLDDSNFFQQERERGEKDEEPNVMKNSFFQRKNKDDEVLFSG